MNKNHSSACIFLIALFAFGLGHISEAFELKLRVVAPNSEFREYQVTDSNIAIAAGHGWKCMVEPDISNKVIGVRQIKGRMYCGSGQKKPVLMSHVFECTDVSDIFPAQISDQVMAKVTGRVQRSSFALLFNEKEAWNFNFECIQ